MFFNPSDQNLIDAMVSYRMQQVQDDYEKPVHSVAVVTIPPRHKEGIAGTIRTAIGMAIMRVGARLAGVGLQTRVGTQL